MCTEQNMVWFLPFGVNICPLAFPAWRVLSWPAFFRPSVSLSINQHNQLYLVRIITRHRFELESTNVHQIYILRYSLNMEVSGLDFQGHFWPFWLRKSAWSRDNLYGFKQIARPVNVRPPVCPPINFMLFAPELVTDLRWNHWICTKHASWDTRHWCWKLMSLTLTFKVILAISTQNYRKRHSTSLLYSDLGRPKGVTRPNVLLLIF